MSRSAPQLSTDSKARLSRQLAVGKYHPLLKIEVGGETTKDLLIYDAHLKRVNKDK